MTTSCGHVSYNKAVLPNISMESTKMTKTLAKYFFAIYKYREGGDIGLKNILVSQVL